MLGVSSSRLVQFFMMLGTLGCQSKESHGVGPDWDPILNHSRSAPQVSFSFRPVLKPPLVPDTWTRETIRNLSTWVESRIASCGGGECPSEAYQFTPALPVESSRGQRILVVEGANDVPGVAYLRHKKKVMGVYDFESIEANQYQAYRPWSEINTLLFDTGDYISNLPQHIPARVLSGVHNQLRNSGNLSQKSVTNLPSRQIRNHRNIVFEVLAELNPDAQFVLMNSPSEILYAQENLCQFRDPQVLRRLEVRLNRLALSMVGIIQDFDINYINISAANSTHVFARAYAQTCRDTMRYGRIDQSLRSDISRYLQLYSEFWNRISYSLPGVAIFKALPNNEEREESFEYSQHLEHDIFGYVPGMIRVGYFSTQNFNAPIVDQKNYDLLPEAQRRLVSAADLFINGGFEEVEDDVISCPPLPEHALGRMQIGMSAIHHRMMSCSWGTPVALTFANRLRQQGRWQTPAQLRKLLKPDREARLFDPLKYEY